MAVADHAGAHWPDRARAAVLALAAEADDNGQISTWLRLLTDCRTAFAADKALPTTVLLDRLKTDPEAPWNDYGVTGLTAMRLGALLREYDIRSTTIRFHTGQAKGYQRADFLDAWGRYCPTDDTPNGPTIEATVLSLPKGEPYQPYQHQHPSSDTVRLEPPVRLKPYQHPPLVRLKPYQPTKPYQG